MIRPVNEVSLEIHRGETLCLVGESGSGKSMLALSVMRVLPTNARLVSGAVHLEGEELTVVTDDEMRRRRGHRIAMVPQDPMTAFDPLYNIGDQIVEVIRTHTSASRRDARQRMLSTLTQVRLPDPPRIAESLPSQLSGGMNQRALIAMALATDPIVILADEPTTALDVTVQAQVLELLADIQRSRGLALLLITHDMGVAATVADRIAVMYAGRIVEEGATAALFARPRHPYTVGLIRAAQDANLPGSSYYSIGGAPPNLAALPRGCSFGSRCGFRRDECEARVPELRIFEGNRAACILEDAERPWITHSPTASSQHA